jgi:diguanylate cyclase (GGDEF)-like protein
LRVSAGIAVFPDHGNTLHELLDRADGALYEAKRTGRDRVILATQQTLLEPLPR